MSIVRISGMSVLVAVAGCMSTECGAPSDGTDLKPLRVAVYVGEGARNIGAYRWLEIATTAEDVIATPVDGAAVRAGALDAADILVMPGGRAHLEAKSLGEEGRERVKSFVRGGGGYIGTCAGFYLVTQPTTGKRKDYLGLIPFVDTPAGGNGRAELNFAFNERAEELAGIKKGNYRIQYSRGPVPVRTAEEVEGTRAEVLATYHSDYNPKSAPCPPKTGHPAVVAAECGKGRLFVFTCHPENDADDAALIQGAFRYVTGREVRWCYPQRNRGQLAVGFLCDDSFGVGTARLVQRLVTENEFDIIPLNADLVAEGMLHNLDAVLAPDGEIPANAEGGLYAGNAERTKAFLARGGRIFAWGRAAETARRLESGVTCVADAEAALAALRTFAAEPVPPRQGFPAKVAKPIRVGMLQNPENSCLPIARLLAFSPEYELKFIAPDEYAKGALDGLDLVIQPGGGATRQYKAIGDDGAEALKRFVREGGKYYGVCAGAFLAMQQSIEGFSRLDMVPFKDDDPAYYRGDAPVKIALTDDGVEALETTNRTHTVIYFGGPAAIPGDPLADTDVKVLARYESRLVNTRQPKPVAELAGKGAILGGCVGKGKVFLSGPHPEKREETMDLACRGLKYLTGVMPTPVHLDRTRGAISVRFQFSDKASADYLFGTLYRDSRFHVWAVKPPFVELPHADAVVLTGPVTEKGVKTLAPFIARGGRVVAVCDTPEKQKAAESLKGAVAVKSYDDVADALLR